MAHLRSPVVSSAHVCHDKNFDSCLIAIDKNQFRIFLFLRPGLVSSIARPHVMSRR